jgi:hypothetical protein
MTFRLIFRDPGVWEFQKGQIFYEERDVIAACIKKRCDHPDRDYGYIQEDSA